MNGGISNIKHRLAHGEKYQLKISGISKSQNEAYQKYK
jgi:hypothetical protein